jgi:hypothetical protein
MVRERSVPAGVGAVDLAAVGAMGERTDAVTALLKGERLRETQLRANLLRWRHASFEALAAESAWPAEVGQAHERCLGEDHLASGNVSNGKQALALALDKLHRYGQAVGSDAVGALIPAEKHRQGEGQRREDARARPPSRRKRGAAQKREKRVLGSTMPLFFFVHLLAARHRCSVPAEQ